MECKKKTLRMRISGLIMRSMKRFTSSNRDRHQERIERLVSKGMKLGSNVRIHPSASIDSHFCFLINIGDNSTITRGVRLLAHDATISIFTEGHGRLGKVDIKENCLIGTNAIVLPGVTIGPNAIVASGSVVNKDIPPNSCVAGVPARYYMSYEDYVKKERDKIKDSYVIDSKHIYLCDDDIDKDIKEKILKETEDKDIYMNNLFETRKKWKSSLYRSD